MEIGKDIERYDWYYDPELFTEVIIDRLKSEQYRNSTRICELLNQQDQRIAELEEQLKNAIVPKFKIGQEFWFLYAGDIKKGTVFMLHIDKGGIVYESYVDDTRYSICSKCDNVFATKEEAQAKLKELQGENNVSSSF